MKLIIQKYKYFAVKGKKINSKKKTPNRIYYRSVF